MWDFLYTGGIKAKLLTSWALSYQTGTSWALSYQTGTSWACILPDWYIISLYSVRLVYHEPVFCQIGVSWACILSDWCIMSLYPTRLVHHEPVFCQIGASWALSYQTGTSWACILPDWYIMSLYSVRLVHHEPVFCQIGVSWALSYQTGTLWACILSDWCLMSLILSDWCLMSLMLSNIVILSQSSGRLTTEEFGFNYSNCCVLVNWYFAREAVFVGLFSKWPFSSDRQVVLFAWHTLYLFCLIVKCPFLYDRQFTLFAWQRHDTWRNRCIIDRTSLHDRSRWSVLPLIYTDLPLLWLTVIDCHSGRCL